MLRNKGSKLFGHDFGRDGFAIDFSEISGDLTTDMDKLSTIWNKSGRRLGLERQEGVGVIQSPCVYLQSVFVDLHQEGGVWM
jgi:hypothetical protein